MRKLFTMLAVAVMASCPSLVATQEFDECFNINLMMEPPQYGGCGVSVPYLESFETCENLVFDPWYPQIVFVHVVASRSPDFDEGIGGLQFGIEYENVEIQGWGLCTGGSEIPEAGWPRSGTGNAVTWPGGCYDPETQLAPVALLRRS